MSDLTIKANKQVRLALATGEISKDELNRRTDRDLRTLYIRFKSSDTAPKTSQEIFALDKGLVNVIDNFKRKFQKMQKNLTSSFLTKNSKNLHPPIT